MPLTTYNYTKASVDVERLKYEIEQSSIVIALSHIDWSDPNVLDIHFKDALSTADKTTLDSIVTAHTGEPLQKPEVPSQVVVMEQDPYDSTRRTNGRYQASSIALDVAAGAGQLTTKDFSFPIPISILSASFTPQPNMEGDEASFYISPDTVVGAVAADVTVGSNSFLADQSVISNIFLGAEVELDDGIKKNNLGRVIGISDTTIQTEFSTTDSFQVATPTYVKMSIEMIRYFEVSGDKRLDFGATKIGGSFVPANTVLRLKYKNNEGSAKRIVFMLEYLY